MSAVDAGRQRQREIDADHDDERGDACWVCDRDELECECPGGATGVAERLRLLKALYSSFGDPARRWPIRHRHRYNEGDIDSGGRCRGCTHFHCRCPGGREAVAGRYFLQSSIAASFERLMSDLVAYQELSKLPRLQRPSPASEGESEGEESADDGSYVTSEGGSADDSEDGEEDGEEGEGA